MIIAKYASRRVQSSSEDNALFEGQPAFRVVDEDLIHLVLRDAPPQHLRHDVVQDVRVAVAAVLGEAVLGVDVVCDNYLVLVALLHKKRQAEHQKETEKLLVSLSSCVVKLVFSTQPACK